jgi:hypothetical protein
MIKKDQNKKKTDSPHKWPSFHKPGRNEGNCGSCNFMSTRIRIQHFQNKNGLPNIKYLPFEDAW